MEKNQIIDKFRAYHFEFKHLTVIFVVLFSFQLLVSIINKTSIRSFLGSAQEWYQKDSAEKLANLTTTSIELLLESLNKKETLNNEEAKRIINSFNIILSQQVLQHNIEDICILLNKADSVYAIDDGDNLFDFLFKGKTKFKNAKTNHLAAIKMYLRLKDELKSEETIKSVLVDDKTFNTFVPFVLRGEFKGAVYIKNTPDFSFITNRIVSNYDETSLIYLSLISLGLLSMYFISTYTVRERDEAQNLLFEEHEKNLKKQITFEKEIAFTKRIYHTHHKAEKIVGFIKGDLKLLSPENINIVKFRVTKYANFISRIIYDMKWYEPPVQTIRNPIFRTDLNNVIKFIVDNIFLRTFRKSSLFNINLDLDNNVPHVSVNEFVVWEIIEPLVQNSIDHAGVADIFINVKTVYQSENKKSLIIISDNGVGITEELLELNENGIRKLFEENISTKDVTMRNSGYGCYIAHQICQRCGWKIEVENLDESGCRFIITISN